MVQQRSPDRVNEDRSKATWWSGELTYARELHRDLTLVAGGEAQSDLRNRQENGDRTDDRGRERSTRPTSTRATRTRYWALYAQAEWQIAPGWDATIGVRHDHYSFVRRRDRPAPRADPPSRPATSR